MGPPRNKLTTTTTKICVTYIKSAIVFRAHAKYDWGVSPIPLDPLFLRLLDAFNFITLFGWVHKTDVQQRTSANLAEGTRLCDAIDGTATKSHA
jgi:hypothetical protein